MERHKNFLFLTSPHSGEKIASETPWLNGLPDPVLFRDADRFVDRLYEPAARLLALPLLKAEWLRYVVDLNRLPEDIDQASVIGATHPAGTHPKGFHWSVTTQEEQLITQPMTLQTHQLLVRKYFEPFHQEIESLFLKGAQTCPKGQVFHLDCHSMPAKGTRLHPDPGETRAEIVLGDQHGKSCAAEFSDLVEAAFVDAGFQVRRNWPYKGGRITEFYGQPSRQRHTLQIEMRRDLYMNENDKTWDSVHGPQVQDQLCRALTFVSDRIDKL